MARSVDNGVYERLGGSWWDEASLLNILHGSITPGRFAYFREVLTGHFGAGVAGLRVLDIGCGGRPRHSGNDPSRRQFPISALWTTAL
jgi:2-polyprenyl-3-methyl-5-hydroxy-6-metoxy-1,4-benzoquinol methylase